MRSNASNRPLKALWPISCVLLTAVVLALSVGSAYAQITPSQQELSELQKLSPEERLRLLQRYRADRSLGSEGPAEQELAGAAAVDDRVDARPIGGTTDQAGGTGVPDPTPFGMRRFGQSLFDLSPSTFEASAFSPVPDDYRIGPGDELIVEMWGEVNMRDSYVVGRGGNVLLRNAGRLSVLGLNLAEAESKIIDRFSRVLSGVRTNGRGSTHVDVTLGKLRVLRIYVVGEALRPGGYEVSAASTIFQALYAAGGPSAIGSMRKVQLIRNNEVATEMDLYDYLLTGTRTNDLRLQDGDTIFLPVAERIVALKGRVRREFVYELLPGEGLRDILGFAGGLQATARQDRLHVGRILPRGQREGEAIQRVDLDFNLDSWYDDSIASPELFDHDILTVLAINPREESYVAIGGAVQLPGRYGWSDEITVSELLERAGGLWKDARKAYGLLVRYDEHYMRESIRIDIDGDAVLPASDLALAPMDSLHFFTHETSSGEREVRIVGEVRRPGQYTWFENMTLADLVLTAGGTLESADVSVAFVSRPEASSPIDDAAIAVVIEVPVGVDASADEARAYKLMPHDRVQIRQRPDFELQRLVAIQGEVLYPGIYTLLHREERLSSLVERAGGLLPTAFIRGARFTRSQGDAGNVGIDLADAIKNRDGKNDLILMPGDDLTVPAYSQTVRIRGEVGVETSVIWRRGLSIGDCISMAGGYSENADEGRTRVIYPNGTAAKVRGWWFDPGVLPGSTITVPTVGPESGTDWAGVIVTTAQILASVATVYLVVNATSQ